MMVLCDQDIFIFVSGLDNASLILLGRLRYIEKDRRLAFWYSCWGMSIRKYHCLMVQVVNSNGYDGNSSFCADFYDNSGFIIMNYLLFGLFKCLWLFRLLHRSLDLTWLIGFVLDRNPSVFVQYWTCIISHDKKLQLVLFNKHVFLFVFGLVHWRFLPFDGKYTR